MQQAQGIAKSGAKVLRLNFFTKFKLWYFYWATVQKIPAFGNTQNDVRNPAQSQPRAWAFVHRDGGFPKRCTRPAGLRTSDGFAKGKTLRKAAVPLCAMPPKNIVKNENKHYFYNNTFINFKFLCCLFPR